MYLDEVVSIIAPAYNHEQYIIDSLSSVAQQTYYNKQLILIDDCSKDRTAQLIEQYINRDIVKELFPAGIKFIKHSKNMNAHQSLNEGIRVATGKYISIINTDDCYEPDRLDIMIGEIKKRNGKFAFSKCQCIDDKGNFMKLNPFETIENSVNRLPMPVFSLVIHNSTISTGNFVFEKDLFDKVGGFSTDYHFIHDWDFALKVALLCEPIYVKETSYLYRFHGTNTIKQIEENKENEKKKNKEVDLVLKNFIYSLINKNATNPNLKDLEVWDYFFSLMKTQYCSYLWYKAKEEEEYGI